MRSLASLHSFDMMNHPAGLSTFFLLVCLALRVSGQELTGFGDVMFATYKMQSIGNWLESSSRTLPGIITSKTKFHPSLNYSLEAIKHENKELIGIILGFGRSSSRMEYIDVNGEGAIDMDWSFKYVGLSVGVPLVHQETWVVAPNVRFLLIDNALGIDDYGGTHIDVRSVNLGI